MSRSRCRGTSLERAPSSASRPLANSELGVVKAEQCQSSSCLSSVGRGAGVLLLTAIPVFWRACFYYLTVMPTSTTEGALSSSCETACSAGEGAEWRVFAVQRQLGCTCSLVAHVNAWLVTVERLQVYLRALAIYLHMYLENMLYASCL